MEKYHEALHCYFPVDTFLLCMYPGINEATIRRNLANAQKVNHAF